MIEETYIPEGMEEQKSSSFDMLEQSEDDQVNGHLYILVHGLGGTAADMK